VKVLIRADASVNIGTGHVMRCLTLAEELKKSGSNIEFVSAKMPGNMIEYTQNLGFPVYSPESGLDIEKDFLRYLEQVQGGVDWIIIDHYGYDETLERKCRPYTGKIMVIDDLANRRHDCDVLLDQNYSGNLQRYESLVPENCITLLGPKYALLRDEFKQIRKQLKPRQSIVKKILVFLGGSDSQNVTRKVLDALAELNSNQISVDVVIGSSNPEKESLQKAVGRLSKATLSVQVHDMALRMAEADLFIGAGGSTTWERMCLGLPSLVIVIADNQRKIAEDLAKDGLIINLGWYENVSVEHICQAVENLMKEPVKMERMSQENMALVDALGTERTVDQLISSMRQFHYRIAEMSDMRKIYDLSNDPDVRKVSINKNEIPWTDHVRWFQRKMQDKNVLFLVVYSNENPFIGQVRFEIDAVLKIAIISISIDSASRGKGYGSAILTGACDFFKKRYGNIQIKAYVLPENIQSTKLFIKSGFSEQGQEEIDHTSYKVYIL